MSVRILIGDCRERLKELPDNSVDSVVCDPPYHLTSGNVSADWSSFKTPKGKTNPQGRNHRKAASKGFMGQTWDGGDVAFQPETWAEVLRVLKPGGHCVAFSGCRTYHRMACAIEDAGFEIREMLSWIFGSGFPKSHNIGDGWGTALKPAHEPICLARKPLSEKSVAANVLRWGTGAINVDGCRIGIDEAERDIIDSRSGADLGKGSSHIAFAERPEGERFKSHSQGRWPANVCHDGSDEVVAGFPHTSSHDTQDSGQEYAHKKPSNIGLLTEQTQRAPIGRADSGSAARFFYCAKATTDERGEGNSHPTVKPVALMEWLVKLVTPKGGTVLDPFMGSGSTGIACDRLQFNFIGCEMSPEYAAIAERRIRDAAGMFADVKVAA